MSKAVLHFVAILPPDEILEEIKHFKEMAWEKFQSRRSLNSPAHITIIPPFMLEDQFYSDFDHHLADFFGQRLSFQIKLKNFSHFEDRVIFVDVEKSEALHALYKDINNDIPDSFQLKIPKYRGFNPHITLAFRDLAKEKFKPAWEFFSGISYTRSFLAQRVVMLRHNGKTWDIKSSYELELSS